MYSLVIAWILTISIEFIIIWVFEKKEPLKLLFYSFLVNSITLPLASYTYFHIYPNLIMVEGLVVIIEGVFLKYLLNIDYKRAILLSFTANLSTFLVGVIWGYI
jgi:predicted neutral ceramidase superfamily lipid hydrolase